MRTLYVYTFCTNGLRFLRIRRFLRLQSQQLLRPAKHETVISESISTAAEESGIVTSQ